ncbi:hypothetical protein LTR22_011221 [Elasticomyces elasticus]|nr:hypothetical protein LTR22_011221 [Elasticomyces elasticus]KAK5753198.1 hypothetical protein LTS12_016769 [Elasticomyces elasticus]
MATLTSFPFERLPAELRIQIYQYVFICELPIHIEESETRKCVITAVTSPSKYGKGAACLDKNDTSLLRTKKTISTEALSVFYAHNTFVFPDLCLFMSFARIAKSGRALVRRVVLSSRYDFVYKSLFINSTLRIQFPERFISLQTLEWTLPTVILSRSYPSYAAKKLNPSIQAFVLFSKTKGARRAQFNKIRFVTNNKPTKQARGKPGYQTADEVLRAVKDELEKLLVKNGVLEPSA